MSANGFVLRPSSSTPQPVCYRVSHLNGFDLVEIGTLHETRQTLPPVRESMLLPTRTAAKCLRRIDRA